MSEPNNRSGKQRNAGMHLPDVTAEQVKPDAREQVQFRRDFLRIVNRVTSQQSYYAGRTRLRQFSLAAAVILIIIASLFLIPHNPNSPVEASTVPGVQGIVVNGASGRSMSGVAVTSLDEAGIKTYLDISDAAGFFDVPALTDGESRLIHFEYKGKGLASLMMGSKEQEVAGFVRIVVAGPSRQSASMNQIDLSPGESKVVENELSLELDDTAEGSWQGNLIHDSNWPSAFNYGRILDGIFSAAGPATQDLSLTVRIPDSRFEFHRTKCEDVQLIAWDATYAASDEFRAFHRGWYITAEPVQDYLRQVDLAAHATDGYYEFEWLATADTRYALLLPPVRQGRLAAIEYYDLDSHTGPWFTRIIHHFDLDSPQQSLYRLYHQPAQTDSPWELTLQPTTHRIDYSLAGETWHRETSTRHEPLGINGQDCQVPGIVWAELFDFTMDNRVKFEALELDLPPRTNPYNIEYVIREIGTVASLTVTGIANPEPGSVAWDFTDDGSFDAWGPNATIPVPYPGRFRVAAYITEPSGQVVKLIKQINISAQQSIGWFWGQPLTAGSENLPAQSADRMIMTRNMVANPQPYGYSTGLFAPGVMLTALPDSFCRVPLRELRVYLHGSPLAGDTEDCFLAAHFMPVTSAEATSEYVPHNDPLFYQNPAGFYGLDCSSVSHAVDTALSKHSADADWSGYLRAQHQIEQIAQGFELYLGIDLSDLPGEAELIAILENFKASPEFAIRYLSLPEQEVVWNINLRGGTIQQGGGLITGVSLETKGLLNNGQWVLHSGNSTPSRIEIETESGETLTRFFDFSDSQHQRIGSQLTQQPDS